MKELFAANKDLNFQTETLLKIIIQNSYINKILNNAHQLKLSNWYLGAGGITQTVWNYFLENDLTYGINDFDLVYFDSSNLDENYEKELNQKAKKLFSNIPFKIELVNEARVHLWYQKKFGKDINPYSSTEDAINSWPTTATSIGVCLENNQFKVYAPFGLNDLFSLFLRPNKTLINKEIYENKCKKWLIKWPELRKIEW